MTKQKLNATLSPRSIPIAMLFLSCHKTASCVSALEKIIASSKTALPFKFRNRFFNGLFFANNR